MRPGSSRATEGSSRGGKVPEGDTVFRWAERLRHALVGERVRRFEVTRLGRPTLGSGMRVRSVESRGKHLLIAFDDGYVLHTHMRMSGAWHVYQPSSRWRRPAHQARAVIEVDRATAVCFGAPVVEVMRERELSRHPALGVLGPDLCQPEVDLGEVLARLDQVAPGTELGNVLLDQRVASGIGNVYKSEVLFLLRLDPFTRIEELDVATRRSLYASASDLLRQNLHGGRRMTVRAGLSVYGKRGRPCPRCGGRIRSRRQGEHARTTFWCPRCQRWPQVQEPAGA